MNMDPASDIPLEISKARFADPLEMIDATRVRWRGRALIFFGGCDYLRLSWREEVRFAIRRALDEFGVNVAASRMTTGNHPLYGRLEKAVRAYFRAERAVLVSSGYLTNLAAAQGLAGHFSHVFLDERAHPSLRDAVRFLEARVVEFEHRNAADLRGKIQNCRPVRSAVLTDGMFAATGLLAPLEAYREAAGPEALLWVDDSHAAGILGARGRGTVELAGLDRENLLQTLTFSKAFGVYGGAILTNERFAARIIARSSVLTGNTPLPLPLAQGVLAAIGLIRRDPTPLKTLRENIRLFWDEFGRPAVSPAPVIAGQAAAPARLIAELRREGIFPSLIHYPGAPRSGLFRFALSAAHDGAQVSLLARTLAAHSVRIVSSCS